MSDTSDALEDVLPTLRLDVVAEDIVDIVHEDYKVGTDFGEDPARETCFEGLSVTLAMTCRALDEPVVYELLLCRDL